MKIRFTGEQSIPSLKQAILEQLQYIDDEYLIRHVRYATLYVTPSDGFGNEIFCQDRNGKRVEEMTCRGPYRSAAEDYEETQLADDEK